MNELYMIDWARLNHCPTEQLTKPGNPTDAGFDIHSAESAIILPFSMLSHTMEEVGSLESLDHQTQTIITRLSLNSQESNQEPSIKVADGIVYRRKYQFPYVKTGIKIQPKQLQWLGIYSRSSCSKYGLGLGNSVGVCDFTFGNEIMLALYSYNEPTLIKKGERVAQLISMYQPRTLLREVPEEEITNTRSGLGSTGTGSRMYEIPLGNGGSMTPMF